MSEPTGQLPSAMKLLEQISIYVDKCYQDISAGNNIDLSGLDKDVNSLCESVAELPVEEARILQPRMQELMGRLTDLGKKLQEASSEVKQQLQDLNMRQKANKAYVSATPPPPPNESEDET